LKPFALLPEPKAGWLADHLFAGFPTLVFCFWVSTDKLTCEVVLLAALQVSSFIAAGIYQYLLQHTFLPVAS
jgi:hypothetical protein